MRKNFFKKLSFVMALAMIATFVAPAAGVFAAADLKLNNADKTLHLSGEPGPNKYNFNIDGKKEKGWKYAWTSSNEDVAEVNEKNGVTVATGLGKAEITVVITDKKGAEKATLTAKVTVKDNIKTVKIANVPDKAIAVNVEYDFNRSFVTLSGATEVTGKTSSITRWSVKDATDKASIAEADGKFIATEAGKYTVIARSFQSTAKYEEWKTTKAENLLLAEDSAEVTVAASIKSIAQTETAKFKVTFDSDMSKAGLTKETAKLHMLINGREVDTGAEKIKSLSLDSTGKVATIEAYAEFVGDTDYKFVFGDLNATFKGAVIDLKNVASIELADNFAANINGTGAELVDQVVGKNADGVIIYKGNAASWASNDSKAFNGCLIFELATPDTYYNNAHVDGQKVYVYENGYQATVLAKFEYYYYDSAANETKLISVTDTGVATGSEFDNILETSSLQYAVSNGDYSGNVGDNSKWSNGPFVVAKGDPNYRIYVRYKEKTDPSWAGYEKSNLTNSTKFRFDSTNTDKLITSYNDNYIQPIGEGVVTVFVRDTENNDKIVGSFEITVKSARNLASVVADPAYVTINNNRDYGDDGTNVATYIVVKDTMGENYLPDYISAAERISGPTKNGVTGDLNINSTGTVTGQPWNAKNNTTTIKVDATGDYAIAGVYKYKFTVSDYDMYGKETKRDLVVTFDVKDARDANALVDKFTRYELQLSKTAADLRWDGATTVDIKVVGKNRNNCVIDELTTGEFEVAVSNNAVATPAGDGSSYKLVAINAVSGSALQPLSNGTYVVSAKITTPVLTNDGTNATLLNIGASLGSKAFTMRDSNEYKVEIENLVTYNKTNVYDIVKTAFKFVLNGTGGVGEDTNSSIYSVTYFAPKNGGKHTDYTSANAVDTFQSVRIEQVQILKDNKVYTFNVNITVEVR